jgi:serpin B
MRATLRGVFLGLAMSLLLVACSSDESSLGREPGSEVRLVRAEVGRIESPDATEGQVAELVRGNNAFAFDMYRTESGDGNLIFSPYSISLAFSMAYAGARGETEEQIADVLNYLPQEAQHPAFNVLEQRLSSLGDKEVAESSPEPFRLSIANAAWGQRGYRFEGTYLETLAAHYGAGLRTLDFGQPQKASEEINAWVADETEDRIEDLVSPDVIDPSTRLVLANAIYFKASWLSRFEEEATQDNPFTLADGSKVMVPMMRQTTYLSYAEGDGYQVVRLPYKGEAVDMLVILPEEGRFEQIEDRLSAGFFDEVRRGLRQEYVGLAMPRFDFETDLDLPKLLEAMGMADPFDPGAADFSGMTGSRGLYISAALHKADITVDEKGTEAAAATAVVMAESAAPEPTEVIADRPFIFAVAERETGAILFLGRVTDPSS